MTYTTRITKLLGIRYPIVQAGMSWASSNAELALAVSQAGALGVIAAGPMYPDALRAAIRTVKDGTDRPFAVNVPLYNPRAAAYLDIVIEEHVPILIASQGGPKQHLARFKDHGVTWLHVTASPEHAVKAQSAGVDAVIAVGIEAGGHPPPDEVGTLVLVRAVAKAVDIPDHRRWRHRRRRRHGGDVLPRRRRRSARHALPADAGSEPAPGLQGARARRRHLPTPRWSAAASCRCARCATPSRANSRPPSAPACRTTC